METLEDGNRSSLLGIIEQDGVLCRDRVHQSVGQRKHACGRCSGMLYRDWRRRHVNGYVNRRRVLLVENDLLRRHRTAVGQRTEIVEDGREAHGDCSRFVAW